MSTSCPFWTFTPFFTIRRAYSRNTVFFMVNSFCKNSFPYYSRFWRTCKPCLPLGEGAAPAAEEGREKPGLRAAPHPTRKGFAIAILSIFLYNKPKFTKRGIRYADKRSISRGPGLRSMAAGRSHRLLFAKNGHAQWGCHRRVGPAQPRGPCGASEGLRRGGKPNCLRAYLPGPAHCLEKNRAGQAL